MIEQKLDAILDRQGLLLANLAAIFSLVNDGRKVMDRVANELPVALTSLPNAPSQTVQTRQISLEFLPLAELGALAVGAQVLLLLRDPWYGYDEILNATFDGENFIYKGRKLERPYLKFIAGVAALPYKLPYLSSDPRFVSR